MTLSTTHQIGRRSRSVPEYPPNVQQRTQRLAASARDAVYARAQVREGAAAAVVRVQAGASRADGPAGEADECD